MPHPPRPVLSWLQTFALVAAPALLWVLASPLSSGADEPAHLLRAASIWTGQLVGAAPSDDPDTPNLRVRVPAGLADLPQPACYAGRPEVPASCPGTMVLGGAPGPNGTVATTTTSGRHPPTYFALLAPAFGAVQGPRGAYAARAVSALLSAAFLATALELALASPGPLPAATGLLAAMTPMVVHLTGVVNPNGLEATAAICAWTALLLLVRAPPPLARPALHAAGLAGVVLTLTRPASVLWLGAAVGVTLLTARPGTLRTLVRDRAAWAWSAAGAAATASSLGWLAVVGNPILQGGFPVPPPVGVRQALRVTLERTSLNAEQLVGVLGWLDVRLPTWLLRTWFALVAVLAVLAGATGRLWRVTVLCSLAVATIVVPAALEAARYNQLGIVWQGRYTLPLAAGVPILAGLLAGELPARAGRWARGICGVAVVTLAGLQALVFGIALRRYVVGAGAPLDPSAPGAWAPPLPVPVLIGGIVAAELALALVVLLRSRSPASGFAQELPAPALAVELF